MFPTKTWIKNSCFASMWMDHGFCGQRSEGSSSNANTTMFGIASLLQLVKLKRMDTKQVSDFVKICHKTDRSNSSNVSKFVKLGTFWDYIAQKLSWHAWWRARCTCFKWHQKSSKYTSHDTSWHVMTGVGNISAWPSFRRPWSRRLAPKKI